MKNVTIYTKDYCPYCHGAKSILERIGAQFTEIDVEFNNDNFNEMLKRSKRRTVPQIFFGDQHIGGYDDLVRLLSSQKTA